jgi:hypothetical protein
MHSVKSKWDSKGALQMQYREEGLSGDGHIWDTWPSFTILAQFSVKHGILVAMVCSELRLVHMRLRCGINLSSHM